jgi:hypothetical protein
MSVCRKTERLLHRWRQCLGCGGLTLAFTREVQLVDKVALGQDFLSVIWYALLSFYQCAIFIHVLPMLISLQVTGIRTLHREDTKPLVGLPASYDCVSQCFTNLIVFNNKTSVACDLEIGMLSECANRMLTYSTDIYDLENIEKFVLFQKLQWPLYSRSSILCEVKRASITGTNQTIFLAGFCLPTILCALLPSLGFLQF